MHPRPHPIPPAHHIAGRHAAAPPRTQRTAPASPALNTVLAVREHAPAEIAELDMEIEALHTRLAAAHARKRLLEALLEAITRTDATPTAGIAMLR